MHSPDFSKEINGQWQVIKSMRKRQELALRAAEKEREEVRKGIHNKTKSSMVIHRLFCKATTNQRNLFTYT